MKPPVISDSLFDDLKTSNLSMIRNKFHQLYAEFRDYFNDPVSCLANIQQIRKEFGASPKSMTTIFPAELTPDWHGGHGWYAYHWGGRSEAQFNIGMEANRANRDRFRVGLGFEFTPLQKGKPELVKETFNAFIEVVRLYQDEFDKFVKENKLTVFWAGKDCNTGKLAEDEEKTKDVVEWLTKKRKYSGLDMGICRKVSKTGSG